MFRIRSVYWTFMQTQKRWPSLTCSSSVHRVLLQSIDTILSSILMLNVHFKSHGGKKCTYRWKVYYVPPGLCTSVDGFVYWLLRSPRRCLCSSKTKTTLISTDWVYLIVRTTSNSTTILLVMKAQYKWSTQSLLTPSSLADVTEALLKQVQFPVDSQRHSRKDSLTNQSF